MLISNYAEFVANSDWTKGKDLSDRVTIARYGIASEIGSLVAAVKKKQLLSSVLAWSRPNDEIREELGDIVWYTAMLANLTSSSSIGSIIIADLQALPAEIDRDPEFARLLPIGAYKEFKRRSAEYIGTSDAAEFKSYQDIAYLTSRTSGQDLIHVCLTRLLFYATVLMSKGFPQVEKLLQNDILNLPLDRTLGMIMWHVAALATTYNISLDDIVAENQDKLNDLFNIDGDLPTPLHDGGIEVPDAQKLPRRMEVSFISVDEGKLQMYANGVKLGDELTDNSMKNDGYRFHDIMHLANAAKLGWSPVLRKLLGRKRKYSYEIDNSQDGARAQIVEEAVVKAIHSEGEKASGGYDKSFVGPVTLFRSKDEIPYSFLKLLRRMVRGLEVDVNRYWEWQEAIVEGHKIYADLHKEGQGTVRVDLEKRTITFDPNVSVDLAGLVAGVGFARSKIEDIDFSYLTEEERKQSDDVSSLRRTVVRKQAILASLGLEQDDPSRYNELRLVDLPGNRISVKYEKSVQKAVWAKQVIGFRPTDTELGDEIMCHVIALTDIKR